MSNKIQLPLDSIEVNDDQMLFVLGGAAIQKSKPRAGSGCGCGCTGGDGCGCECNTGGGCGCGCKNSGKDCGSKTPTLPRIP